MNDTTCTYATPLTDVELLMALDNQATPEVTMHLSHCPGCQTRTQRLQDMQQALTTRLFRADCPPALELGEYQMGLLPVDQSLTIARHVSVCPHCAQEIAALQGFMAQPQPDVAPSVLDTVRSRLQVVVAELVSGARSAFAPPALAPAYAGLRGGGDDPLIYEANDVQLSIEVQNDGECPGHLAIFGLITGLEDGQSAQIELWRDQQRLAGAAVDAIGNFTLGGLTPGDYELFITNGTLDIHVQNLCVEPV